MENTRWDIAKVATRAELMRHALSQALRKVHELTGVDPTFMVRSSYS